MNFADMLSFADIHQLTRIANHYECVCNENSKNELIQSILSTVGRRDIFEQHINGLGIEDLRFLNSILFDQRNSFSLEELIARVQQTKFDKDEHAAASNPRDTIIKFKYFGWLFNGYSQQTKYLFQVPVDLKNRFRSVLEQRFQTELQYTPEPSVYRDEQMLLLEDCSHFLRYVDQNDIPLNAEGAMYKRNQQQILELFAISETIPGKGGWRFGYGRRFKDYPNRLSFIYDYAYYQGLIEEKTQSLELTAIGRERVANGQKEQITHLYRFWLRLYKGPIPNLVSLVHWIDTCSKRWVTAASVKHVIRPFIKPFYYDDADSILEQRIFQMLMHLGLLRIGEDEHQGQVIQMTTIGRALVQGVYVSDEDTIQLPNSN